MLDVKDNKTKSADKSPAAKTISPGIIAKVDLTLEAFVGNAEMTVAELQSLKTDDVIELSSALNQSVELRLNNVTIALGELVAVGDNFGIRVTQLSQ